METRLEWAIAYLFIIFMVMPSRCQMDKHHAELIREIQKLQTK